MPLHRLLTPDRFTSFYETERQFHGRDNLPPDPGTVGIAVSVTSRRSRYGVADISLDHEKEAGGATEAQ